MDKYYLNDEEKKKVIQFNEDEVMREAVRKVIMERIYNVGVLEEGKPASDKNWAYNLGGLNDFAMDDEKVGNMLKVTTRALGVVEDAFSNISQFTNNKPDEEEENPAV